jgi:hypothetical protein
MKDIRPLSEEEKKAYKWFGIMFLCCMIGLILLKIILKF